MTVWEQMIIVRYKTVTSNNISVHKLLVLDMNSRNQRIVCKQMIIHN